MKCCYLFCLCCFFTYASSFAQVQDNFTDLDFTSNPAWSGETGSWLVTDGQLRSNLSVASSSFYLSTPSSLASGAQWEFYVKLAFNTSGTNYVDIFLTSETENLKNTQNGYFVRIGGTRDEISLYKKIAGVTTLIINGTDGVTNRSSNTLKIKVARSADYEWTLERDIAGTGTSYITEGTVTDNAYTASSFFGILVQQSTTSFFNKHFFDDFIIAPIDVTPPTVTTVKVLSANSLEVTFSEPVSASSAQDAMNYLVNHKIGQPTSATLATSLSANSTKVVLNFPAEFVSSLLYSLTITNVEDLNRNLVTEPEVHTFTYIAPFTPGFRDIVINEIMADPSPTVDLPDAEFIELYNTADHEINLAGFTFTDGTSIATFGAIKLAPKSFLIVCSSSQATLFTSFGNVAGLSSFPSLNNSGETLSLKNPSGKVIDKVTYATSWYKDTVKDDGGWSLEQINPQTACNGLQNWQASTDMSGGTPGRQNTVFNLSPDIISPKLLSVEILSNTQIELKFSKPMDSLSLKTTGNYVFDNELSISSLQPVAPEYTAVKITLNKNLQPGQVYSVTVSQLADCPGNLLSATNLKFGVGATPQYNQLLITEIMADESPKVGLPEAEFIELYNPTNQLLSLDKVSFTDGNGTSKITGQIIQPGEYLIICATSAVSLFSPHGRAISVSNFSLNNSGEPLTLRNEHGKLIYSVNYSPDWYQNSSKSNGGWSLEMIDVNNACGEENNWIASEDAAGGTPGKINSVYASKPDLLAPQLLRVIVKDSLHLGIFFNEKLDSLAAINSGLYAVNTVPVEFVHIISPSNKEVVLSLATPLLPKQKYTLTITHVKDCNGNISKQLISEPFTLPEQADSTDIVINEVLFNSRTGGVDFVEVFNRSDKYINLKNWQLANFEKDSISNLRIIIPTDYILNPNSYLALTTNSKIIKDQYPRAREENILVMKSMPSYNDDAGTVILLNNLSKLTDRMDYTDDMHFSLIDDLAGVSLERINPNMPSNNTSNWHSAASAEGYATPGYRNSQFLAPEKEIASFTIIPRVFTPDDDGRDDFTTFNYAFANNGNTASITIFDIQGREIKKIARNQLLAAEGFYSWDGTNDQGAKVRTGAYVVYFTLFDMKGKQQTLRERVIVGAKF